MFYMYTYRQVQVQVECRCASTFNKEVIWKTDKHKQPSTVPYFYDKQLGIFYMHYITDMMKHTTGIN